MNTEGTSVGKPWPDWNVDADYVIERQCELRSIVTRQVIWPDEEARGEGISPSDCTCLERILQRDQAMRKGGELFRNRGEAIMWIEEAVRQRMEREGYPKEFKR